MLQCNVRFGDPECQLLMLRPASDLLPLLVAACEGRLAEMTPAWRDDPAVVVVMAAQGYPGTPLRGTVIGGLEAAAAVPRVQVFHAGTVLRGGQVVADGGRVMGLAATGPDLRSARDAACAGVAAIDWPEGFCRSDIAARAV